MPTYVAFLRAINLGARRRVPMVRLVEVLQEAGFAGVATHLATGNVRLESPRRSTVRVEGDVERALAEDFGFEVPTVALPAGELGDLVDQIDDVVPEVRRSYVTLLKSPPPDDVARELDAWSAPGEGARVGPRWVLWWAEHDMREGRLGNDVVETRLGVATTRTTGVIRTVRDKWGG